MQARIIKMNGKKTVGEQDIHIVPKYLPTNEGGKNLLQKRKALTK